MEYSIFGNSAGPGRLASTVATSNGLRFSVELAVGPVYVKAIRFYRATTGIFGTITGAVFNGLTGTPWPGTTVQVTLPQGSGPTGWITMTLPTPINIASIYTQMVVVHFPGGTGNGYPCSQNVPAGPGGTTNNYWFDGPGWVGLKHGPMRVLDSTTNSRTGFTRASPTLTYPGLATTYGVHFDLGLDLILTDVPPAGGDEGATTASLFGNGVAGGPSAQVAVTGGAAVAGLEFTPLQDVWVTELRVYRPQGRGYNGSVYNRISPQSYLSFTAGQDMHLDHPDLSAAKGALYKVTSASSGELVPGSTVQFPQDRAYVPVFGLAVVAGSTGWQIGFLAAPLRLVPGQRYRIAAELPAGRGTVANFFQAGGAGATGLTVGPLLLHGPDTATGGAAASLITGSAALAFPTSATTANPMLDVMVTTEDPNAPGEPEEPTRIWGVAVPTTDMVIGVGSRTVGLEFTATESCQAYGLRYLRHQGINATAGRLYAINLDGPDDDTPGPTGTVVYGSEVSFPSASTNGWKFAAFPAPIRLAAGQRYRIAIRFPAGYAFTANYFTSTTSGAGPGYNGVTSGVLQVPSEFTSAGQHQGSYSIPDAFPDQPFQGNNPWIDITVGPAPGTAAGAAGAVGEPSNALRLWGVAAPAGVVLANQHTRIVGLEFMVERAATAHGYRFYRPSTALTGPVQARLYVVGDNEHGTEVVGGDTTFTLDTTSTGWMWAPLRATIALVGGRRYKLAMFFPGGYPTTPDWYLDGQPGAEIDQQAGILRGFSVTNATRNAQPTTMIGGTYTDAVAYPSELATDNPWIDITVTDGDAGASAVGEEPSNAMRAWGRDDPTGGDITQNHGPLVAGHQFTLSQAATLHGLRMWRPDLRQQATTGRLYRVDTATSVTGTTVTFPPATSRGWSYAPLPAPVGLVAGVPYRVVAAHPVLAPFTPNRLTAPVNAGVVTTASSWTADTDEITYPQTASVNNFWLDVAVTPGGVVPEDTLTLFPAVPDASVSVRSDFVSSRGVTFAGQRLDAPDAPYWVKAIRFYRASTAITGTITGRLYEVTTSGRSVPVPNTDVVFTVSGTGWQTAELPFPAALSQLPWYRAAVHFPNGYPVTSNYFTTGPGGQTRAGPNGVVYAGPYNYTGGDGIQGAYANAPSLGYPNAGHHTVNPVTGAWEGVYGENYWVDVVATTAEPEAAPPALPRFPLAYSQFGQISSTNSLIGETIRYNQVASAHAFGPRSVGLEFTVDAAGFLLAYRFPRLSTTLQARTVTARLYRVTGPSSGSPVAGTETTFAMSADYWQSGYLATPVALLPGQRYKAVFLFPDATPIGVGPNQETDRVRGPLRVYANVAATGGATLTAIEGSALAYPTAASNLPSPVSAFGNAPVVDLWVATSNPQDTTPGVRSVFDGRRPSAITYAGWEVQRNILNPDGTITPSPAPPTGFTAGMEFYVTTDTCYLRSFRYWRAPYPAVTQVTEFRLYRVTGTQAGVYYPGIDADYDNTTGVLVAGTTVTMPEWTADPNQTESYAEGWITVSLPTPVALTLGQRYRVAAWYPTMTGNKYDPPTPSRPMTDFYWDTGPGAAGHVDGPLIAPPAAQALGGAQYSAETRYDNISYPNSSVRSNRAQYWIDVEVLDSAPLNVDGGIVTVAIPPLAGDPRRGGYRAESYVFPPLNVIATATTARHTDTGPTASPLNVIAAGIGAREIATPPLNVVATVEGSKGVEGTVEHLVAAQPRQVALRPKGVADTVDVEVAPVAEVRSAIPWTAMPREVAPFEYRPDAGRVRFIAQNIMTRQFLHWDLPINDPTMTWNLSGPFELSGTLDPAYIDLLDINIDEWATFIHVELQGRIVGTGIMQPYAMSGEELTIDAIGISSYPHGLPYMENFEEFFPDIMDVIRECWRHIQSFPNGNMGVMLPTGYMGVPLYGDSVYDNQTGEFLGWKKWSMLWPDLIDMGSLIDGLAQSTPFDYIEVHLWNPTHTDVLHGINHYYPRAGGKRHELRFAEGENIVEAVSITEPDDAYASEVILKGAGEGPTQVWSWVGDVLWDRLRRVTVITDEQVQTVEVAQGMAIQELIRRLYLRGIESLVIEAFSPLASFGNYEVGDDILVEGMVPWTGEFGLWHRILAISLQPESGLVTLRLQRSEAFRYGREITYSK